MLGQAVALGVAAATKKLAENPAVREAVRRAAEGGVKVIKWGLNNRKG
jgi:hypothetical protein